MHLTWKYCCLAITLALTTATAAEDWSALARQDIEASWQLMLDNHPGPVDPENPGFMETARTAHASALALADQAEDAAGYTYALRSFTAPFRDGHFPMVVDLEDLPQRWSGLVLAWRNERFVVAHAEEHLAELAGSELVGCDETPASKLILDRVFRFEPSKPDQPAYWARQAPLLLLDGGNPFAPPPSTCEFALSNGLYMSVDLEWTEMPERFWALSRAARFGERPATGMRTWGKGRYWINLPDFAPDEDGQQLLRALFEQVRSKRAEIRDAKVVVIDVRGNQGGSSAWGDDFVAALWGEAFRDQQAPPDSPVDWRASRSNLEHLNNLVTMLRDQGREQLVNDWLMPVVQGVEQSLDGGHPFYRQMPENRLDEKTAEPLANPVNAHVVFLTHGQCASACLDFGDLLLALGGVTHVGYPTSSDTNYMELRIETLPSGKARLGIPVKVYRNRPRASGAFYDPVIRYDGLDWSDAALEAWVDSAVLGKLSEG